MRSSLVGFYMFSQRVHATGRAGKKRSRMISKENAPIIWLDSVAGAGFEPTLSGYEPDHLPLIYPASKMAGQLTLLLLTGSHHAAESFGGLSFSVWPKETKIHTSVATTGAIGGTRTRNIPLTRRAHCQL